VIECGFFFGGISCPRVWSKGGRRLCGSKSSVKLLTLLTSWSALAVTPSKISVRCGSVGQHIRGKLGGTKERAVAQKERTKALGRVFRQKRKMQPKQKSLAFRYPRRGKNEKTTTKRGEKKEKRRIKPVFTNCGERAASDKDLQWVREGTSKKTKKKSVAKQ